MRAFTCFKSVVYYHVGRMSEVLLPLVSIPGLSRICTLLVAHNPDRPLLKTLTAADGPQFRLIVRLGDNLNPRLHFIIPHGSEALREYP